MNSTVRGVLFGLAGTALFAPIFAAGKFVDGAVPALAIVFMRYLGGFLTVSAVSVASRKSLGYLKSPDPKLHLFRAFLGAGAGICIIHASAMMPVANATSISMSSGLIIILFAAVILKERITRAHLIASAVCAAGAYVVIYNEVSFSAEGYGAIEGVAAALGGAVFMAMEGVMIKILARRENALSVLIYVNGFATLLLAGPAFYVASNAGLEVLDVVVFIVLGPLAIAGQFCNIKAYRLTDAAILGPVGFSWILFAALIGFTVFGEVPDVNTVIGAALIITGGIWLTRLPAGAPAPTLKKEA